jgi:hypothetical protein
VRKYFFQAKHQEYVFSNTEFSHGISREPSAVLEEITILDVRGAVLVDAFIDWEETTQEFNRLR